MGALPDPGTKAAQAAGCMCTFLPARPGKGGKLAAQAFYDKNCPVHGGEHDPDGEWKGLRWKPNSPR